MGNYPPYPTYTHTYTGNTYPPQTIWVWIWVWAVVNQWHREINHGKIKHHILWTIGYVIKKSLQLVSNSV